MNFNDIKEMSKKPPIKKELDVKEWLLKLKEDTLKRDLDVIMVLTGPEGSGKSTTSLRFASWWQPDIDIKKQVIFSADKFRDLTNDLPNGSAIVVDEGILLAHSRTSMKKAQTEFIEVLATSRFKNHFIIINIPRFSSLDTYVREHRAYAVCDHIKQGICWMYGPKQKYKVLAWENRWKLPINKRPRVRPRPAFRYYPRAFPKDDLIWQAYSELRANRLAGRPIEDEVSAVTEFDEDERSLSVGATAKMIDKHANTVVNYFDRNILKGYRDPGNRRMIYLSSIRAYMGLEPRKVEKNGVVGKV